VNLGSNKTVTVRQVGRRRHSRAFLAAAVGVTCTMAVVLCAGNSTRSVAQQLVRFQERIGGPVRDLTAEELAALTDPLFKLVLEQHADTASTLSEIERRLLPTNGGRMQTFVVSEMISDPLPTRNPRVVIAFTGQNGGFDLDGTVMLSPLSFSRESFPDRQSIEAWAWDEQHGVYNYYRLDVSQGTGLTWKFQGSSTSMTALDPARRAATCTRCHVNGAPVMKELLRPWNNWHSRDDTIAHLRSGGVNSWPVATDPKIDGRLTGAELLEGKIIKGVNRFNRRRVEAAIVAGSASGDGRIKNAASLLRSLFVTTEVNLISSLIRSGLHPFPNALPDPLPADAKPQRDVGIPNSFFLNAGLLGEQAFGSIPGLQLASSLQFMQAAQIRPAEYAAILASKRMTLAGRTGTTNFAWFVPEASQIDNHMVQTLMDRGILTPQFVAAVLAIDLRTPVFSKVRAALLRFLPQEFEFSPLTPPANPLTQDRHPDRLTRQVIANLQGAASSLNANERDFLELLRLNDPLAALSGRIDAYLAEIRTGLNVGDPARRQETLGRLFDIAHQRRVSMLQDAVIGRIVESPALLPGRP